MIKNNFFYFFLIFLTVNINSFSQDDNEFSLIKTPEQKEREEEKKYLNFQKFFFNALKERAQENYDKAITELDNCQTIYPNNVAVNFEYVKNYYDLKQYNNALDFINKVLPKKPKESYVLELAVKINRNLRNYNDAILINKKLIALNPIHKNTLVYLLILNKEKEKAIKIYKELEKEQLLDNRKDFFKRMLFKKSVVKNNNNIVIDNNSIALEKEQFKKEKTFENLKKLLEKEKKLEKHNELVIDSSEGLSLFPAQPYVYYINGFALNKQKRYKDALNSLKESLDYVLDENQKLKNDIFKQIAISYKGLGEMEKAKKYTNKIVK
jgi:tetratricopeptide (TPR) repeat protein